MNFRLIPLLLLLLCTAYRPAAAQQPQYPTDTSHTQSDSLQQFADSLERRAAELERQLEALDTTSASGGNDSGLSTEITRLKNEILAVKEKVAETIHEIAVAIDTPKQEPPPPHSEEKVHVVIEEHETEKSTGSFCMLFEYTAFDVDPLKHLATHDRSLAGIPISFDGNMLTLGFMGYFSKENNVRLGNGLSIGYKAYTSDIFSRPSDTTDTAEMRDSIVTLRVIPLNFGFLCEKALRYSPVDFVAGIMLGGHLTVVVKEEQAATRMSSFISEDTHDDSDEGRYSVALSPAVFGDLHGGISFALSEKTHMGIDGVVRVTYAYEGFGAGFGDYVSITPGIRLRLAFGNAG